MTPSVQTVCDPPSSTFKRLPLWLVIAASVMVAYSPLFNAEFTVWDDCYNVAENSRLNPPTFESVAYYWKNAAFDLYIPVTYTTWAAIARVGYVASPDASGSHLNPYLFHIANVLLHAAAALMVLEILLKLIGDPWAASVGAGLGAASDSSGSGGLDRGVEGCAGGGVVAGGAGAVSAGKFEIRNTKSETNSKCEIRNINWYAIPICLGGTCAGVCHAGQADRDDDAPDGAGHRLDHPAKVSIPRVDLVRAGDCHCDHRPASGAQFEGIIVPLSARPIIAGDAIAFYMYKLIWPLKLAVDYGRTPRETLASGWAYVTALVPLAMAIVLWRKRRSWPIVCAGAVIFVLGMLPVSGLVRFDFQIYSTVATTICICRCSAWR